jgi:hypothetical protein
MSCHQNGGPIFASAPWSETDASRAVVGHLHNHGNTFYGVPVNRNGSVASAIDRAVNRAGLLPVMQRIWRQGCGGAAIISKLRFAATPAANAADIMSVRLAPTYNNSDLHARLPNGDGIEHLELHWRASGVAKASATGNVALTARLILRHDFQPVESALNTLMQGTLAGANALFDNQPFDSLSIMRALFAVLGIEAARCCDVPAALAPPAMEP